MIIKDFSQNSSWEVGAISKKNTGKKPNDGCRQDHHQAIVAEKLPDFNCFNCRSVESTMRVKARTI